MVWEGDADIVLLPGVEGEMGVLPNHAPLLTTLNFGILTVRTSGKEEIFTISGGIAEIQPKIVTVLADVAENVEEIDINRAQAARDRAQKLLEEGVKESQDSMMAIEAALRRSNLRLSAVRRFRKDRRDMPPQQLN
jgi:F-type H+-transporting ATPase subunit epsilon